MKSIRIAITIPITLLIFGRAACGCDNQDQAAANQPVQPGVGKPLTNAELTKQRQALIQKHKDEWRQKEPFPCSNPFLSLRACWPAQ